MGLPRPTCRNPRSIAADPIIPDPALGGGYGAAHRLLGARNDGAAGRSAILAIGADSAGRACYTLLRLRVRRRRAPEERAQHPTFGRPALAAGGARSGERA